METNSTNTSVGLLHLWTVGNLIPNILIVALGVPLNLLVLALVMARALVKVSEISALNQSLCELGICVGAAVSIAEYFGVEKRLEYVTKFVFGLLIIGRLHFMSLVCGGCYLAVAHPMVFLRCKLRRTQLAVSGVSWSAVLAFCFACTFASLNIVVLVMMLLTIVSLAGQLFCCVQVLRLLVRPAPGEPRAGRQGDGHGKKLAALGIIATLLLSSVVMSLPFVLVGCLHWFLPRLEFLRLNTIAAYLSAFGGYIQPLLWICRARKLPCIRAS